LECDLQYKFNSGGTLDRQPWFDCSCCPTNMCRFLPSVPGYIYAQSDNKLYVNLFVTSSSKIVLTGNQVTLTQETQYPWDGNVKISVSPEKTGKFALCLRIPGWAENQPVPGDLYAYSKPQNDSVSIKINGKKISFRTEKGYALLDREWNKRDVVNLSLPMGIRQVIANKQVKDDLGKVALERGPIVYCLEAADNKNINDFYLSANSETVAGFKPELLGGIETISCRESNQKEGFTAIPYFAWNNRGINQMKVWIPLK